MNQIATDLQDEIEGMAAVLEAGIAGKRGEMVEVVIDPLRLESYNVTANELINVVRNSLNLMGVYPFWVQVVTGIILLVAILLNTVVNRRVEEWARTSELDIQEVGLDKDDGIEGNQ